MMNCWEMTMLWRELERKHRNGNAQGVFVAGVGQRRATCRAARGVALRFGLDHGYDSSPAE